MARYARSNTRMFVFKGTTPPTTLNGASVGDQWTDTSTSPCLEYKCTSISPMTWVTAEGSGSGGGLSDGDYGDITVSGSGTALTIDNTAVTFAKMQNVSTGVLLGRSTASTGSIETITPGTGLSLSGGSLSSTITQYTDEQAQDTVATMIQNGTGISWTYNDVSNTLTPAVSLASFSTTNLSEGSNLYYTTERAQDDVLGVISGSNGISYSYNDAGNSASISPTYGTSVNTICQGNDSRLSDSRAPNGSASGDLTGTYPSPTIATSAVTNAKMANMAASTLKGNATGGAAAPTDLTVSSVKTLLAYTTTDVTEGSNLYYTDERAQDAVGTILTDSSTVDFTYNDAANTITAAVIDNTSTQKIEVAKNSAAATGTRKQLNLIEGSNVTLTVADDGANNRVNVTIAASGGSGTFSISQTEIDFGSTPVADGTFTITDAAVTSSAKKIMATLSYDAPTGKDQDELEMDDLSIICAAGTGQFSMYVRATDGSYLADKFKINYTVA